MSNSKIKKDIAPEIEEYLEYLKRKQFEKEILQHQILCNNYDFEYGDVVY